MLTADGIECGTVTCNPECRGPLYTVYADRSVECLKRNPCPLTQQVHSIIAITNDDIDGGLRGVDCLNVICIGIINLFSFKYVLIPVS